MTLESFQRQPIRILRGPCTEEEGGSSWDLPVWAVYKTPFDEPEIDDSVITWSDRLSRKAKIANWKAAGGEQ